MYPFVVRSFSTSRDYLFSSLCHSLAKVSSTTRLNERVRILNDMIDDAKQNGIGTVKKTVELISGKVCNYHS